mmetsp:Transcript_19120/g.21870  ORF Transcript_19120/g.21870 Transcript_19120/m.21870 type:complete len:267 (-) Transcript_19120:238-1038(-)|eukprot:CAMPEP_0194136702 /NCGR_PEP_ID=MMETSP0152-20130528/6705_1 /TAXON_ID=1049557 /ORGANISM="Thalassiothrix antarctica, Strain L6-D1" /LENGTH=266 /DNA_ID=CAMNT_0038833467 /DNA_START=90 /DNA_END=893 /DNA_ORIENTATION=-
MVSKYSDIAKGPKDLLNDDFTSKVTLKCKKNAGPAAVTIETDRGAGGALTSKIGLKFNVYGLAVDKVQMKSDGGMVLETSMSRPNGLKVAFKGNKNADMCVDYKNGNIYATGVLDVKDMSKFSTSACVGLANGMQLGGNLTYGFSGKNAGVTAFNAGGSYGSGPLSAALTSSSKFSQFNVDMMYKVNNDFSLASSTTHSKDKAFDLLAVGGAFKVPSIGTFKAKVGSNGILNASLVGDVAPKVTLTGSASISTSGENFNYGLGIVI